MGMGSSRLRRAVVATALGGMLALGTAAPPMAGAGLQSYAASSEGFSLQVTIDLSGLPAPAKDLIETAYATAVGALPAGEAALLPGSFPFVIDQTFIKSAADASPALTRATAVLVEGNLRNEPAQTTNTMGQSDSHTVQTVQIPDQGGLSVLNAVTGELTTKVLDGPLVNAEATLATVSATLMNVASLLPPELAEAINQLVDVINDLLGEAVGTVQGVVDEVTGPILGALPGPLQTLLGPITEDLAGAVQLPDLGNILEINLLEAEEVVNTSTSQRSVDGRAVANSAAGINSISVLGGFLSTGALSLVGQSEAAGVPGSAKNSSSCSIADVRLGDTAGVSLDGTNLYVDVAGQAVAVPVVGTEAIADLKAQVDEVLGAVGLTVELCGTPQVSVAADGTSASQTVSAFLVEFAPTLPAGLDIPGLDALGLSAGDSLAKVTIDPTVTTSVQAVPAAAPAAPGQPQPAPSLPRTGAQLLGAIALGFVLLSGAAAVRSRMGL